LNILWLLVAVAVAAETILKVLAAAVPEDIELILDLQ
jgi:hypothetical protein